MHRLGHCPQQQARHSPTQHTLRQPWVQFKAIRGRLVHALIIKTKETLEQSHLIQDLRQNSEKHQANRMKQIFQGYKHHSKEQSRQKNFNTKRAVVSRPIQKTRRINNQRNRNSWRRVVSFNFDSAKHHQVQNIQVWKMYPFQPKMRSLQGYANGPCTG